MDPLYFILIAFGSSIVAGLLGSLLGLGGGVIVVPVLTLVLGVDVRLAVGASMVALIATSTGAAAGYVRQHLTNIRVAMYLETATVIGAVTGALTAGLVPANVIFIIFAIALFASALMMLRHRNAGAALPPGQHDPLADRLRLHGQFHDASTGKLHLYKVGHTKFAWVMMYLAGTLSGLLGIGSGVLKVPTMDLAMRLPLKVSTATSNFMIGVTAAASAGVYFTRGDIDPTIAAPVACGILIGATIGSKVLGKLSNKLLRMMFVVLLGWVSYEMFMKGIHS